MPGDLDGDGYDDLVFVDGYCVRIAYGSKTWPHKLSTSPMANLVSSAGVAPDCMGMTSTTGEFPYSFGVASVGDVDRDGYADFLITFQPGIGSSPKDQSGSLLVYGGPRRLVGRTLMSEVGGARFLGGARASGLGDVNGDGFADFGGWVGEDLVVFFGAARRFAGEVTLDQAGARLSFETGHEFSWVRPVGDFDGDGNADFALARVDAADILTLGCEGLRGRLWLILGGPQLSGTIALDHMPFIDGPIVPIPESDQILGDLDGDGLADLAFSTCQGQTAIQNVLYGRTDASTLSAPADVTVTGPATFATADVDGDGHLDWILGDPSANSGNGEVYVLRGTGTRLSGAIDPTQGSLQIPSAYKVPARPGEQGESVGVWLSAGKDVDGDGLGDVLVGAYATHNADGSPSADADSNFGHMILLRGAALKATMAR
jgi:hypothetical protein